MGQVENSKALRLHNRPLGCIKPLNPCNYIDTINMYNLIGRVSEKNNFTLWNLEDIWFVYSRPSHSIVILL